MILQNFLHLETLNLFRVLRKYQIFHVRETFLTFNRTNVYGAKVDVPGSLDLLLAGTCCVDFSHLNGNRQDLEACGESGDTFAATVQYMVEFAPKMVIFENVKTAPWVTKNSKRGFDHYINKAGYASRHLIIDAKKHYVPQTRQRGYMICVRKLDAYLALNRQQKDLSKLTNIEVEEELDAFFDPSTGGSNQLFDKWELVVRALEVPASAPADAWLFDTDDSRLVSLQEGEKQENTRKATPWEKCAEEHLKYCSHLALGNDHPLTQWHDNTWILPDYFVRPAPFFTLRTIDTIDIAHKRSATRGIDNCFYGQV